MSNVVCACVCVFRVLPEWGGKQIFSMLFIFFSCIIWIVQCSCCYGWNLWWYLWDSACIFQIMNSARRLAQHAQTPSLSLRKFSLKTHSVTGIDWGNIWEEDDTKFAVFIKYYCQWYKICSFHKMLLPFGWRGKNKNAVFFISFSFWGLVFIEIKSISVVNLTNFLASVICRCIVILWYSGGMCVHM